MRGRSIRVHWVIMSHDGKGVSKEEAIRRAGEGPPTQLEDPAAQAAERQTAGKPAQVTPGKKRAANAHPEDVPPPAEMRPPEGPGS